MVTHVYPLILFIVGPSWSWSYGSWIYNYLCNRCLSLLTLWVRISLMATCTRRNFQQVCTPVSSTNKTYSYDIAEILLKVALNTITIPLILHIYVVSAMLYYSVAFLSLHQSVQVLYYLCMIIWSFEINLGIIKREVNSIRQFTVALLLAVGEMWRLFRFCYIVNQSCCFYWSSSFNKNCCTVDFVTFD